MHNKLVTALWELLVLWGLVTCIGPEESLHLVSDFSCCLHPLICMASVLLVFVYIYLTDLNGRQGQSTLIPYGCMYSVILLWSMLASNVMRLLWLQIVFCLFPVKRLVERYNIYARVIT